MKVSGKLFREAAESVWQPLLRLHADHKVLMLSLLNAFSLFLFALVLILAWVGDSGEAQATSGAVVQVAPASTLQPESPSAPSPADTPAQIETVEAPKVAKVSPRRPSASRKPMGRRDYPVQVRRQLQVFTQEEIRREASLRPQTALSEDAELLELSEEWLDDPELVGHP